MKFISEYQKSNTDYLNFKYNDLVKTRASSDALKESGASVSPATSVKLFPHTKFPMFNKYGNFLYDLCTFQGVTSHQ